MDPSPLDLTDIEEMEIFRIGTHNGEEFSDTDLEEMAANFHALKDEVRPKLKLTHRENQEELGGLASYGDVSDVYVKADELGEKRLYAKLKNVPFEVAKWIQDRRFPERSIELYPEFTLGTGQGGSYRNVLKAVALLGNEMPAVTGMDPVTMLKKYEEQRTICFAEFCACEQEADVYLDKIFSETQAQLDDATKKLENW